MPDVELGPLRFGIIGAGRLGCVLGETLRAQGFDIVAATSASPEGRTRASHRLDAPVFDDPLQATVDVDVVLVCTPDRAIAEVASRIAERDEFTTPYRLRIVHTSGALPLSVLQPASERGHDVLGMHPLQTITERSTPTDLVGAAAGVTARDEATTTFGHALAHTLGMLPFTIDDAHKPLYHAAGAFAANFTVTVMSAVRDLARAANMDERHAMHAFSRLARAALERVETEGPADALTGPIVRGDAITVRNHLEALERDTPQLLPLYRALARATVDVGVTAGRVPVEQASALEQLLATPEAN